MTDMELACMVAVLVMMSDEHFKLCGDYVQRMKMLPEERQFMERVISVAKTKRKARTFG